MLQRPGNQQASGLGLTKRQRWLKARHIYTGESGVSSKLFKFKNEEEYFEDMERLAVEALREYHQVRRLDSDTVA